MRIETLIFATEHSFHVSDETGEYNRTDVEARSEQIANDFVQSGVSPGQQVLIVVETAFEFISALLGAFKAGAVAVPLEATTPKKALLHTATWVNAKALFIASAALEETIHAQPSEWSGFNILFASNIEQNNSVSIEVQGPLLEEAPALILFSSGTTGKPKGIVLSHKAIVANIKAIVGYLQPVPSDTFFIAKSLTHSSTITGELFTALYCGSKIASRKLTLLPRQLFQRIEECQPHFLCAPPSLLQFLLNANEDKFSFSSLHTLHISGSILNSSLVDAAVRKFPGVRLINGYGLSEACPRVAQASMPQIMKDKCIGKPLEGLHIEVRRPDGSLCNENENGELYVSSPSLMTGYFKPNASPDDSSIVSGWLATGDLGYFDYIGDYFVVGRKDDMIITSSHNVMPNDTEEIILQLPEIKECMVFGVADELLGERLECGLVLEENNAAFDNITAQIRNYCAQQLVSYQVPKRFHLWEQLPTNANGKRSRKMAREHLNSNLA